jgi:MFS transporter, DHA1 family, inner membrane transport protein
MRVALRDDRESPAGLTDFIMTVPFWIVSQRFALLLQAHQCQCEFLPLEVTYKKTSLTGEFFALSNIRHTAPASLAQQAKVLAEPRLLLVYAKTAIGYGGSFIPFTFLAPILTEVSGFSAGAVGWVMLVYGVSVAVGNIWGGRLADRMGPIPALKIIFALLGAVLLVFNFAAPHKWLALVAVLMWGAVAFGNVPGLQVYVVKQAERFAPQAVDVASGLNIAAFNLGIALAAWVGGLIVTHLGLMHTPWIGALVVLVSLALTQWSGALDRRAGIPVRASGPVPVGH